MLFTYYDNIHFVDSMLSYKDKPGFDRLAYPHNYSLSLINVLQ